jgi:PTS system mannose-specific IIA component
MLIKLSKVRAERPLSEAIELAQDAGRKYINVASQVLHGK